MIRTFRVLGLAALLVPCYRSAGGGFPEGTVMETNIPYLAQAHARQTLDLYRPTEFPGNKLPLLVWIHGGAWKIGDKAMVNVKYLVEHGFALASINYRLTDNAIFPAQIQDCNAALNFLLDHAEAYGFDTNRVVVGGTSAGGHLALLLGLARIKEFGATEFRPRAVLDFFGVTDFLTLANSIADIQNRADLVDASTRLLGAPVSKRPDLARNASPTSYAHADNPPVLILHGDEDDLVPLSQSKLMYDALQRAGVKSELIVVKGGNHDDPAFETPEIQEKVLSFLDIVLAKP